MTRTTPLTASTTFRCDGCHQRKAVEHLFAGTTRMMVCSTRCQSLVERAQTMTLRLTTFRADGWPLCPQCGEDELWSPYYWEGTGVQPPIQTYIDAGLTCYQCHWHHARKTL
jgi:hypothetical protein